MKIKSWAICCSSIVMLGVPGFAAAIPQFPQPVYNANGQVENIIATDLNKDGKQDLVMTSYSGSSTEISEMMGDVNGTFHDIVGIIHVPTKSYDIVADFNGDQIPDLAIVENVSGEASLVIGIGKGDGTFTSVNAPVTLNVPFGQVTFGDVNGDGKLDFIIADPSSGELYVILGNGDGSFKSATSYNYGGNPMTTFVLADVNHDGRPDIVGTDGYNLIVMFGNGDGTFAAPAVYAGLNDAEALVVADINGDKYPDVVTTGVNQYSVLLNNGDGTFQSATSVVWTGFLVQSAIALADLDGDGYPDLILLDSYSDTVNVLHNQKNGTFAQGNAYIVGSNPQSLAIVDLNNDQHPDLLIGELGTVSVLFNKGDGTFPTVLNETGTRATAVIAADLNGDNIPDIVSADGDDTFKVQISNGNGTFQPAQSYATGFEPYMIAAADLNGDKYPDLVVVAGINQIQIWINQGDGTFSSGAAYTIPGQVYGISLADINGDGHPDLVITFGTSVYVYMGTGVGTFDSPKIFTPANGFGGVALADLNSDGHPDLVIASQFSVDVYLGNGDGTFEAPKSYQNCGTQVAVADMNGDGHPDIVCSVPGDPSILFGNGDGTFSQPVRLLQQKYINLGGTTAMRIADVNGDGLLDVITANQNDAVSVLVQNSDHSFTVNDGYQTGPQPNGIAVADITGDGHADIIVSSDFFTNAIEILEQTSEHAPVLSGITLNLNGSTSVNGKLIATDQDGDTLDYYIIDQPAHGSASVDPSSGVVTYVSGSKNTGESDNFSVIASDGTLNSKVAAVSIVGSGGTGGSGSSGKSGGGSLSILELLGFLILWLLADCRLRAGYQ